MGRRRDDSVEESSFDALLGALARAPEKPVSSVGVLAAGHRVGRYEIQALLGQGAMGVVYRARDEMLGRDVALKVLLGDAAASPVDRFRREVIALAAVSHENVVAVHDAGIDGDLRYVVLELVDGQTLRERLRAGALAIDDVLRLARDLANGLAAAHAAGVVHRDLKPENVLVDRRGLAKLVDFGLARVVETDRDTTLTEAGSLLGTVHYMAPEQVRCASVDQRADYFALGAVMYEALTGRRAFDAPSRADVMTAVLRDQPPTVPTLLGDERARRLLSVAFRCLEKEPARRFQSASEILAALEDDAAVVPSTSEIPATRYATSSGVHIAYQVVSPPGPPTLLAAPPFISNIEVIWESPSDTAWIRSLAACSHFIHYDRRGVGMSDPISPECTMAERIEDLRAVLDAERVERTFLLGVSEGGPAAIGFAATYPERTRGLVLIGSFARLVSGDGYPHGLERAAYDGLIAKWVETWGTPKSLSLPLFSASRRHDPDYTRWGNRYERQCASPGTVRRLLELQFAIDVREQLARVTCPVLVLHRRDDPAILVDHGRYVASRIPGARYVEVAGNDHAPSQGNAGELSALVQEFIRDVAREDRAHQTHAG